MIKKYSIANFNIKVSIDYDEYFDYMLSPYENDFVGSADVNFNIERTANEIRTSYSKLVKIAPDKYYCVIDGEDAVINHDPVTGKIIALTRYNHNYTSVNIISYDVTRDYNIGMRNFNHNLVGNAMHHIVAMNSGFVFHSSSLACSDGGVLFSAPSGTGKSTHTSLWMSEFDDVEIINDDTPIIRINDNGIVQLCGTPWAGTSEINVNKIVPLKAIVFIAQAKENTIVPLSVADASKRFFDATVAPLTPRMHSEFVSTFGTMFTNVPMYLLSCNMNPEAAHIARNAIFL